MLHCKYSNKNQVCKSLLLKILLIPLFFLNIQSSFSVQNVNILNSNNPPLETSSPSSADNKKLVQVDSEIITEADYQAYLRFRQIELLKTSYISSPRDYEKFQKKVLDEIVEQTMIFLLAIRANITYSQEEIDRVYEEGIQLLGGKEAYQRWLNSFKLTDDYVKNQIKKKIMVDKYIENIEKTISVTDDQVKGTYQRYKNLGLTVRRTDTYDFANILIVDFTGTPEKEKLINEIYQKIQAGEDFFALAQKYSEDTFSSKQNNMYYEMTLKDVQPEIKHYLILLPAGSVSPPFRSRNGWNIIKIISKNTPGEVPFAKLEKGIREDIIQGSLKGLLRKELEKLRNEITISYFYN